MINFEWHDVRTPVFISIWVVFIVLVKIVFHASERLVIVFPDSALLIVCGFSVGTVLDWFLPHDIYLDPDLFFLYLLPPIALEAGYFMPNEAFVRNIGTILTYAVVGTLWNIASIGGILHLFSAFYSTQISFLDLMLFSTLISAVDPVAVLSVFTEVKVNELLYICVFGESILNDAVTIVLYHALSDMAVIGSENLLLSDLVRVFGSFVLVALGGVLFGTLAAIITGLTTKMARTLSVVQPLICLLFPYLAYLLAEMCHYSGILAIVFCGLLMKPYVEQNMSEESRITVKYFLKTIASQSEAMIFIFLGLSSFSRNHSWDVVFTLLTVFSCLLCRFIGVYLLSYLCNKRRMEKIGFLDQFIISYGGLRGAIAYGLAMTLDKDAVPAKDMLVSTTVMVICFTVFIQGTTIKPLVKFLRVKTQESNQSTITSFIFTNVSRLTHCQWFRLKKIYWLGSKPLQESEESITINQMDRDYVQPFLTSKSSSRGEQLVEKYDELSALVDRERREQAVSERNLHHGSTHLYDRSTLHGSTHF